MVNLRSSAGSGLRLVLNEYGFSTRCRNLTAANELRAALRRAPAVEGPALLDVGSGQYGVCTHLSGVKAVGVDRVAPSEMPRNFEFRQAEIDSLPFEDRSFPVVSCIDVIEHLPLDVRAKAIEELVRVAGQTLLVAFPHGAAARESDARLLADFRRRSLEPPDWVVEHLRQAHPTDSEIEDRLRIAAAAQGRRITIRTRYCEPLLAQRLVRMSSRTRISYVITSLTMSMLLPALRTPPREKAYRAVLVVDLSD